MDFYCYLKGLFIDVLEEGFIDCDLIWKVIIKGIKYC